eukprot:scaffold10421_cov31-Tisochrysis_lutea.AAC.3
MHHPDDGAALAVRDGVEDLLHLFCMDNGHLQEARRNGQARLRLAGGLWATRSTSRGQCGRGWDRVGAVGQREGMLAGVCLGRWAARLDGVGGAHGIELKGLALHVGNELLPHGPLGMKPSTYASLHPGCETLIEPQVIPPLHGHKITKPLVSEFMDDNLCNALQLA